MQYNTQQPRLPMPEYGRSVQNMVNHALTITDREERQRCANTIIKIMGNMYPLLRDLPDFKQKLWDHLAIMADFKLDIDYPYEIVQPDTLNSAPERIPYSNGRIRYRHYGFFLERLIKKAMEMPEGEERAQLVHLIAIQMRKNFITWNKDSVEIQKLISDLEDYTHGAIRLTEEDLEITDLEPSAAQRHRTVFALQRRRAAKKK
ncbi:MAG: DUF4290 domain-containing protein [Bacteroidaceae bacterium]|nr:DUF4290 domain-containing protein [Bacteroidaceae bacterium]MBQ6800149.1 DUF4290 domain-containing protein [Bacteroidaceae bacterium]MBR6590362.1 DUF4290 domain-containing protein [Bacteroidaceae bacterium]